MGIVHDLGRWLWRLFLANPMVVRVVATGSKRQQHLWARLIYLVALLVVFLLFGGLLLGGESRSLSELAKQATRTFVAVSVVQLFLMSFIAPIFCAGAITQEKDANTFHILLTTPLSNGQIVLGSLFSRLVFVWALLLAGLPIFCITMVYGGVTSAEIFESFGLAACTGLVAGSIAIMISFLKVGTRRTIFAFFVGVAVYLLGVGVLGLTPAGQLAVAPPGDQLDIDFTTGPARMSWLAPVHPFLALLVVTGQTPAPPASDVYHYGWPARWLLAYPQYGYMLLTTLASSLMVLLSLIYVRRGAREGERTFLSGWIERFVPRRADPRRRRARRVWRNPIAWREAATRASAGGRSLLRPAFALLGLAGGIVLLLAQHNSWWGLNASGTNVDDARFMLTVLVWIELAVILLVVTNTAATTLTREKEALTIELLLSTPLTSRYIIAGMLQGLVRLVIPLIVVPTVTIALFAVVDLLHPTKPPLTTPEAVLLVPGLMIAFSALAAMIGLHFSLLSKKTVRAVMLSTAVVLGAAGLLTACGLAMIGSSTAVAGVVLPFTPFPAIQALLNPWSIVDAQSRTSGSGMWGSAPAGNELLTTFRVTRAVFSAVAIAIYLAITYALYQSMVRGFDMTVRRQSA